jgi:predicted  nucleic acid-binding Zn-ribbon protein
VGIFDIFRVGKIKRELAETKAKYKKLQKTCARIQHKSEAIKAIGVEATISQLRSKHQRMKAQLERLQSEIRKRETELIQLDETILLQSFGIYETSYDFETSEEYKARLDEIRSEQKRMTKEGTAVVSDTNWEINGSRVEGRRVIKDYVKLLLRSFNNECDTAVTKAKYNNVESLVKKIRKAAETINKLGARMGIRITSGYITLKIEELYLAYEYALKKQEEKEEQRRIRELEREEARVRKEIEDKRKKLQKEATHFSQALNELNERVGQVVDEQELQAIEQERQKIQAELDRVSKDILTNEEREQNTRAGYVYIISNIGSFGEGVYKIGMTRRLNPQERVDELGDASVPYRFDVHAMVFSEDAPKLENALHEAFAHRKMNLVNTRREFFRVSLKEIQRVVRDNFDKAVEFTLAAEAMEYRQSEQLRKQIQFQAS